MSTPGSTTRSSFAPFGTPDDVRNLEKAFNTVDQTGIFNYVNTSYKHSLGQASNGDVLLSGINFGGNLLTLGDAAAIKAAGREGLNCLGKKAIEESSGNIGKNTLFHYTNEEGFNGIMKSEELFASSGPKNARYGVGQYLTDIGSGERTVGELSRALFGVPWVKKTKMSHFLEIDVSGLEILNPRQNVFFHPSTESLDISGRIVRSGPSIFKP